MKKIIYVIALFTSVMSAQVGIGTTTPSGALEVNSALPLPSTQKAGLVPPTVALSATNSTVTTTAGVSVINPITIGVPTTGTIVYNTHTSAADANQVIPGFYYWDGAAWQAIKSSVNPSKTTTTNVIMYTPDIDDDFGINLGTYTFLTNAWTPATAIPKRNVGSYSDGVYFSSITSTTTLTSISLNGWLSNLGTNGNVTIHIVKYSLGAIAGAYTANVTGTSLGTPLTFAINSGIIAPVNINITTPTILAAGDILVCYLVNNTGNNKSFEFSGQLVTTE